MLPILILWLGCLTPFLASTNQPFINVKLNKATCSIVLLSTISLSWWILAQDHSGVISAMLVLVSLMVMWLTMIFSYAHLTKKVLPLTIIGAMFFGMLSTLGGL